MKNLSWLLPILCTVLVASCEHDFIEDDLTGKIVSIIAPADQDTVSTSSPIFWWNEISGARSYRLQIVYPDFNTPQQLLYDTAITGDRFYPSLQAGYTYQWRIRPENGSSEGDWVTRTLTIDSSVSLVNQTLVITNPATNGTSSASSTVNFNWNTVSAATFYRLEITNTTTGVSAASTTTTLNGFSITLAQGSYELKVRAENAASFTAWSYRTFTIDLTAPSVPVLVAPANNTFYSTAPSSILFDWTNSTDAYTDSLEISTDSTFATGIQLQTLLSASQSTYTWSAVQAQTTYFWRVRSIDAAGNKSNYSSVFKFIVN